MTDEERQVLVMMTGDITALGMGIGIVAVIYAVSSLVVEWKIRREQRKEK